LLADEYDSSSGGSIEKGDATLDRTFRTFKNKVYVDGQEGWGTALESKPVYTASSTHGCRNSYIIVVIVIVEVVVVVVEVVVVVNNSVIIIVMALFVFVRVSCRKRPRGLRRSIYLPLISLSLSRRSLRYNLYESRYKLLINV
jgi:hypothetical protein